MSRRTATTLSIEVRLRVPPGSNTAEVLDYVRRALRMGNRRLDNPPEGTEVHMKPIKAIDADSMIVKLLKKETVYL